jgi:SNF2 family DNA or RNA helicase
MLNTEAIARADWVLTTYETLRDYDRDFGAVRFAAILFDEAQKIKTPGIRLTDAAKAMNADFRVALTGTPVENRLADLWCITDAVHPALLGDLKTFSRQYEASPDPEALKRLKRSLDTQYRNRPQLLLRRLKSDRLPDLPRPEERRLETRMPAFQSTAYEAAISRARERRGTRGATLEGLQDLRRISLHPDIAMTGSDQEFIDASARLSAAVITLDSIHAAGERALIFLEDRALQARLSTILQRRYRLSEPPMIINGTVPGPTRQARVDRFQTETEGFSVMILSSRAGGVGLTLTAANHAIHLSRWWNPAVEDQCTGRVLRIGQTRPVFVYLPSSTLGPDRPSFDQNLDDLLNRKRKVFHEAFMPPEATENERDELFRATIG